MAWPKLAGKVNIFVGDADTFYLHEPVRRLQRALEALGSDAVIEIHEGRNHATIAGPALRQRVLREMVEAFRRHHPEHARPERWR